MRKSLLRDLGKPRATLVPWDASRIAGDGTCCLLKWSLKQTGTSDSDEYV